MLPLIFRKRLLILILMILVFRLGAPRVLSGFTVGRSLFRKGVMCCG
jgi:hypothetical protein